MGELDGIITRKQLDNLLQWAGEKDDKLDMLETLNESIDAAFRTFRSLVRNERPAKLPGGRRPTLTPAKDMVWYVAVQRVMNKKNCSRTRACELLAGEMPYSAEGESTARTIARAYKQAHERDYSMLEKQRRNKLRRVLKILRQARHVQIRQNQSVQQHRLK